MICNFNKVIGDINNGNTSPLIRISDSCDHYTVTISWGNGLSAGWLKYHVGEVNEMKNSYDIRIDKDLTKTIQRTFNIHADLQSELILLSYINNRDPRILRYLAF